MKIRSLAAIAGAASLTLALTGCGSGSDAAGSSKAGGSGAACPDGTLTFGVEPYEDAANLTPVYQTIGKALGDELGCKVDVQITQSYVAEILAMKNGKLDIGQFGPLGFVFASREAKAAPVASFADKNGKLSTYTAGIWVPANSPIKTVKDLSGHSLALAESGSTSGDALPRMELVKEGVDKSVKTMYAGGHPESQLALIHGKVDAAEINSQQLASSTKSGVFDPSKYRQIWKSDPIANDPITVSPNLDDSARKAITDALLNLPPDAVAPIGKYLDFTSPDKPLVAVDQSTYRPLFDLADALGLTDKDL